LPIPPSRTQRPSLIISTPDVDCSFFRRSDTRYTDLLTNLRLSKSDVKDLLREGPNWPSIRREVPSSSLVDLLNILHADRVKVAYEKTTFETRIATFEAEKATLEKRVEAAEQALKTPPVVAPTNGNGMNTPTSMSRSRSSSRSGELADEISRERDRLRLEVDSARREREGEREKVLQLRERVLALETSCTFCSSTFSSFSPSQLRPFHPQTPLFIAPSFSSCPSTLTDSSASPSRSRQRSLRIPSFYLCLRNALPHRYFGPSLHRPSPEEDQ
jgi:hypothetical protein